MNISDKYTKLGGLSITILLISFILIIVSIFAPYLLVRESPFNIDFSNTGEIGDTIGGIMNPFVGISGVLLTFLAFYIQYKANRLQRELFRQELDFNKFENQFYEMIRLHKENVNELEIGTVKFYMHQLQQQKTEEIVRGRKVFDFFTKELEICYYTAKMSFPKAPARVWINEAYSVFFHGLNGKIHRKHEYFKILDGIKENHKSDNYNNLKSIIRSILKIDWEYDLNYSILDGYSHQLAHYYRHLYQTVKFIVRQENDVINYEEKRKYLRILRSQLSNNEQVMLFYNWLSDFGKQWESNENKFFTDYRMIHNIYQELIISDIILEEIFDIKGNYLKEKNREHDHLFEYQD